MSGTASVEDPSFDPRAGGESDGVEFAAHAAGAVRAFFVGHVAAGVPEVGDNGHPVSIRLEAVAAGEDEEEVRPAEPGDFGAEAVVVAEAELFHGNRVVLVDDRNNSGEGEEFAQGVLGVAPPLQAVDVAVGEEERPLVISNAKRALPFLMALILTAVFESITEMVTRTPRGSRSVGGQDPAGVVQSGVPLALV